MESATRAVARGTSPETVRPPPPLDHSLRNATVVAGVVMCSEYAPRPTPTSSRAKAAMLEKEHGARTMGELKAHGQAKEVGANQEEKVKEPAKEKEKGEKGKEPVACMGSTSWEVGEAITHGEERNGMEIGRVTGEVNGEGME